MIKKYMIVISILLVFLMFASTSSASFLLSKGKIYGRLSENSGLKNILDRFSQVVSNTNNNMVTDEEKNDGADGDDLMSPDGPEQNMLLPKIWNMIGEKTPDDGNEVIIDGDNLEATPTIDVDTNDGTTQNVMTVDIDENTVVNNEMTVDEDGCILNRVINVIVEQNGELGATFQRVVERTYAPGTTASDGPAEHVVEGGVAMVVSGGNTVAENKKADVVLTNSNQQ